MNIDRKTIYQKSVAGRLGCVPQKPSSKASDLLPSSLLRTKKARLPEVSELDVVRHFTNLSRLNVSVDSTFYPLGSCTMKYNAKIIEAAASLDGFASVHPLLAQIENGMHTQGSLRLIYELENMLSELCGMKAFTLQPMAGAHGEFTGAMLIAAYHKKKGNKKTKILCPDSAHGTNPASAALAGYEVVDVPSKDGMISADVLAEYLDDDVAALMMTCPNTLGLFEKDLSRIVAKLREVDALLYYDGANMNAIMGKMRVGDVGFDVVHLNLHKTMGTPHGGGGPGSGPVGVSARLEEFLPVSRVVKENNVFKLKYDYPDTIGYIAPFYGNFGIFVRAYAYMTRLGGNGLSRATEYAVLNANYMKVKLAKALDIPYQDRKSMHEFVASAKQGYSALDIAKGLLENGYHAPTIYFPLIVKECLMFEPTETESKQTLDEFIEVMERLCNESPETLHNYPLTTPVRRLDETSAARNMILTEE